MLNSFLVKREREINEIGTYSYSRLSVPYLILTLNERRTLSRSIHEMDVQQLLFFIKNLGNDHLYEDDVFTSCNFTFYRLKKQCLHRDQTVSLSTEVTSKISFFIVRNSFRPSIFFSNG